MVWIPEADEHERKERQINCRIKGMRRGTEDNFKKLETRRESVLHRFSSPVQRRKEDALNTDGRTPVEEKEKKRRRRVKKRKKKRKKKKKRGKKKRKALRKGEREE